MSYGMFAIEKLSGAAWSALPCESAALGLASLAADTLRLGGLAYGVLAVGGEVRVTAGGETIFSGIVSAIGRDTRRGRTQRQAAAVSGIWHVMERTLYTQSWPMWVVDEAGNGSWQTRRTGRVNLNQAENGDSVSVAAQIADILACCDARIATDDDSLVGIPELIMPYDDARDLWCSQAVQKSLRFMPRAASYIVYGESKPVIRFTCPDSGAEDAAWLSDYAAAGRLLILGDGETDEPPAGVQIEIETGGDRRGLVLQEAGDVSDPAKVFRASLSLAGREESANYRYLDVVTEAAPATSAAGAVDFTNAAGAAWLIAHCSSLQGLHVSEVAAGSISRSGEADKAGYPRVTSTPIRDLKPIGVKARLETFTANVNVVFVSDDGTSSRTEVQKMRVVLQLVATDAETKRYSYPESSGYAAAESAPAGLAAAMLEHLADCGRTASVLVRLVSGLGIPRPGDCRSGLPAQSVEIDLKRETAVVSFGSPSHLSADDLASVLSGFRNLRRATAWGSRRSDGDPDENDAEPATMVMPVKEESFSLGSYSRVGISKDGKKVDVNPADLKASGDEAKLRTVNFKGPDGSTQNLQVLATAPVEGEAEEEDEDPCDDHPEGGDGVAASGSEDGESGGSEGVPAGGGDDTGAGGSGGVAACATQCDC
jgi:hypothetical protein